MRRDLSRRMIHYHGTPITPLRAAEECLMGRHACVSHWRPDQISTAMDVCQSFMIDNGAFSAWRSGKPITDWKPYYEWVGGIYRHPGFDFAVIPDVIDGDEEQNLKLVEEWPFEKHIGVPVWHLHEPISYLQYLAYNWPRIAFGSSGEFSKTKTPQWWTRMREGFDAICEGGLPVCKVHLLRGLDPEIFTKFPASSGDSVNIAVNIGTDDRWKGSYTPPDKPTRAYVMAKRIEAFNSAQVWGSDVQS